MNDMNEQGEHEYPYEPQPGKTHWEDCWKAPGHHNCAVARVYRLQRRLEEENEHLRELVANESEGAATFRRRVDRLEEQMQAADEWLENALTTMRKTASDEYEDFDSWQGCAETMEFDIKNARSALDSREDEGSAYNDRFKRICSNCGQYDWEHDLDDSDCDDFNPVVHADEPEGDEDE